MASLLLPHKLKHLLSAAVAALCLSAGAADAASWWKPEWTLRKKITVDTGGSGAGITEAVGTATVLVRLHEGNYQFLAGREDGGDIRFIAEDDKTPLVHHVEKFDSLLNEAFVWVRVPEVKPGAQASFWLYYGNAEAAKQEDSKGSYDADTALVYHFAEPTGTPVDASAGGVKAEGAGVPLGGALIGGGVRLTGQSAITLAAAPALEWAAGGTLTWSAWIKPTAPQPDAVLFSRREAGNVFLIGLNNGVPYVEAGITGGKQRSAPGAVIAPGVWRHLAVTASGGVITLYLDGKSYATLNAALPALKGPAQLGKDGAPGPADAAGFAGEIDELQISKAARPAGLLQFAAFNQGTGPEAQKRLTAGEDESAEGAGGHDGLAEHLSLLKEISKSLTFDGWIVIALCAILAVVGWVITVGKLIYLNRIGKASKVFLRQWQQISTEITALDHADEKSIKSLGGTTSGAQAKLARQSPLFHLYHLGSQEIQKRMDAAKPNAFPGLSGRSIQAIRAILDGGQVREVQRLNGKLVFLTIGIAGGPYLGLLGTVIGVMITFAVIARSGEVDINSIAPGIAGALLATVAGLAVAIPALFAYSYLSSRIKEAVTAMHIFIDEFVARIAEAYPTANE